LTSPAGGVRGSPNIYERRWCPEQAGVEAVFGESRLVPPAGLGPVESGPRAETRKRRVFLEMVPMPVGIEPAKQEEKMKKLFVVLLALGLIAAFSMTASAADVKFYGQYYAAGMYESNRTLGDADTSPSSAQIWQRARIGMNFKIAEGLTFYGRFDALEKAWGSINQSDLSNADRSNSRKAAAGTTLQESIEFERAYVNFKTAIGAFDVGYRAAGEWGTGFGDEPNTRPRIQLTTPLGPFVLLAIFEKQVETLSASDQDGDKYMLAGVFRFKGGDAGLLYVNTNLAYTRPAGYAIRLNTLAPYFKAKFGPVYVEAEVIYTFGKWKDPDSGSSVSEVKADGLGAYALAKINMGPVYFGGSFGYSSGDNDANDDTDHQGPKSSTSWSPTIILGDANYKTWVGSNVGSTTYDSGKKQNLVIYSVFGGFNPTPKLKIEGTLAYAEADKQPVNYSSKKMGTEFDITATYKIYDNLTYMVGAGYLWPGDFFKGTDPNACIDNDYTLLNKLTLNF
jgi:hypothetical protein